MTKIANVQPDQLECEVDHPQFWQSTPPATLLKDGDGNTLHTYSATDPFRVEEAHGVCLEKLGLARYANRDLQVDLSQTHVSDVLTVSDEPVEISPSQLGCTLSDLEGGVSVALMAGGEFMHVDAYREFYRDEAVNAKSKCEAKLKAAEDAGQTIVYDPSGIHLEDAMKAKGSSSDQ